jgi:hypothetical protein
MNAFVPIPTTASAENYTNSNNNQQPTMPNSILNENYINPLFIDSTRPTSQPTPQPRHTTAPTSQQPQATDYSIFNSNPPQWQIRKAHFDSIVLTATIRIAQNTTATIFYNTTNSTVSGPNNIPLLDIPHPSPELLYVYNTTLNELQPPETVTDNSGNIRHKKHPFLIFNATTLQWTNSKNSKIVPGMPIPAPYNTTYPPFQTTPPAL